MKPLDELIQKTKEKRRLDAELAVVELRIKELKPLVRNQFQQDGTKSVTRDGFNTYIKRNFYITPLQSKEHLTKTLVACGLDDLVAPAYDKKRLASYVKEAEKNGEVIPDELKQAIDTDEEFTVVCRKS